MDNEYQVEVSSIIGALKDLQIRADRLDLEFLGRLLQAAIIETAFRGASRECLDDPKTGFELLCSIKARIIFAGGNTNVVYFPRSSDGRDERGSS